MILNISPSFPHLSPLAPLPFHFTPADLSLFAPNFNHLQSSIHLLTYSTPFQISHLLPHSFSPSFSPLSPKTESWIILTLSSASSSLDPLYLLALGCSLLHSLNFSCNKLSCFIALRPRSHFVLPLSLTFSVISKQSSIILVGLDELVAG